MQGHRLILPHDTVAKEARVRVIMGAITVGAIALVVAIAQVRVSLSSAELVRQQAGAARDDLQLQSATDGQQLQDNGAAASAVLQKLLDDAKKAQDTQPVSEPAGEAAAPADTSTAQPMEVTPEPTPQTTTPTAPAQPTSAAPTAPRTTSLQPAPTN